MANEQVYLKRIDRLFRQGTMTGLDDGQFLERFVAERDDSALEALVERHGPMVLGVCRRWLGNPHDADDAFQATFLILIRKARGLRDHHRLGPWLHGVAYRVAARARIDAARRRALEERGARAESDDAALAPDRLAAQAELSRRHRRGDRSSTSRSPRGHRALRPGRPDPARRGAPARLERGGLERPAGTRSRRSSESASSAVGSRLRF